MLLSTGPLCRRLHHRHPQACHATPWRNVKPFNLTDMATMYPYIDVGLFICVHTCIRLSIYTYRYMYIHTYVCSVCIALPVLLCTCLLVAGMWYRLVCVCICVCIHIYMYMLPPPSYLPFLPPETQFDSSSSKIVIPFCLIS